MKIAVVGCGAVGSFYGAQLARAGQEVHFLLRSDYEAVRQEGLRVESPGGDFTVRPRCAQSAEEIGPSDLVIVALKTTANDQFPTLLPPLVGKHTAVLTLQNGLGNEDRLAQLFPAEQILGGLCFVCLNRVAPGRIRHLDHGDITLGAHRRTPDARTLVIAESFREAGVGCVVKENLEQAHWEKLVWNVPFNGLGVAGSAGWEAVQSGEAGSVGGWLRDLESRAGRTMSTDRLLGDAKWEGLVRNLMGEVVEAGRALGHAIRPSLSDELVERTRTMGAYKASTVLDFEKGLPIELESLFLEPLRQSRAAGRPAGHLGRLCAVLTRLNEAAV